MQRKFSISGRYLTTILINALLLTAGQSFADSHTGIPSAETLLPDSRHEKLSKKVLEAADRIDLFFGNERVEEDAQQTRVKARLDLFAEEDESLEARARITARLSLPRLKNKWSVIINGSSDEDGAPGVEEDEDEDRSLSLRFDTQNTRSRRLSFDLGFKRPDGKYELFGRVRYQKTIPMQNWLSRWDNRLYYYQDFGAEYDGILDFDRVLSSSLLFRASTRVRWWENDKKCNGGICPQQHFVLYQRMKSPKHALSYESNTNFETKPFDGSNDYISESNLRLRYRRSTPWDWAFIEVRPTIAFPRERDYDATWRVMLRFEGIFGYHPNYETLEFGPEKNLDRIEQ